MPKKNASATNKPEADMLFEASWEVCNKVGGIFTVLSSKSKQLGKHYQGNYVLIGPYVGESSRINFREESVPERYRAYMDELKSLGIVCYFGKWLIEGDPDVILVDFAGYWKHLDGIKKELWEEFGVDSLDAPRDYDEPLLWSYTVGVLMEKMRRLNPDKRIVFQAHEWLTGAAILHLKAHKIDIATVFTTHATILGRAIAGSGRDLYAILDQVDPDEEAAQCGITAKFSLERASAREADVFTTVSQITAREAAAFLGREVDLVLPNGLDMSEFPSFEEVTQKHNLYRNRLREFALYYFFPYYSFDLEESLFFFTASRYEFHNKGLDVFIEALGRLNKELKEEGSPKTVITFFFVPGGAGDIRTEIISARESFHDIKDSLLEEEDVTRTKILYSVAAEKPISEETIFKEDFQRNMKRKLLRLKAFQGKPAPLSTHYLNDEGGDPIMNAFRQNGLENRPEDRVKVIFYPVYLSGVDGLCDLDYYQAIQASHLGVFPSFYEPWGYTPLEAAALGVPAITSDLSGFGRYFKQELERDKVPGIRVIDMENAAREDIISKLDISLKRFTDFDRKERIDNKMRAREIAFLADWENFALKYIEAQDLAVKTHKK